MIQLRQKTFFDENVKEGNIQNVCVNERSHTKISLIKDTHREKAL